MVIINIPLSTIPALPGGLRDLAALPPAAGTASLTMAGAGMAAAAMPVVETGSPENREAHRQQIGVVLHLIVAGPHPIAVAPLLTAGEDNC